ncbi:polysaccharide biosynthesis tyrosine autokinase [Piscinibacter sakaiensis]|uniref:polysaccharide biosynthesis tyrosine autokinase n=1 Tax=Piscinibacter sakaiensis TaxID=1547922 RepID=UPI003AAE1CFC
MSPSANTATADVRSIGEIIKDTRNLTADQVEQILAHQRDHGVRFGEAAIALGYATNDDVLLALSEQFSYPYASEERRRLSPELVALNEPFGQKAEAIRAMRSQILQRIQVDGQADLRQRRAIAVVSASPGDGKTYLCANLAVTFAQLGKRTLVVDCDLRGPRMHEVFAVDNDHGLSGLLTRRRPGQPGKAGIGAIKKVDGVPNLFVLPVGIQPPNPLELIEGTWFDGLLAELTNRFDQVIVDTPASSYGADAPVIASRCGLAVVVARKNVARMLEVQELVQVLANASAKTAGVVMNEF